VQAQRGRVASEHGREIDEAIRHVHEQLPARREVAQVERERFAGEQVDRDGVAGEGVEQQQVEPARGFGGEREARVAGHQGVARAALQEVELRLGHRDHQRVQLVESVVVAGAAVVGAQHADPEPDDAHAQLGV